MMDKKNLNGSMENLRILHVVTLLNENVKLFNLSSLFVERFLELMKSNVNVKQ